LVLLIPANSKQRSTIIYSIKDHFLDQRSGTKYFSRQWFRQVKIDQIPKQLRLNLAMKLNISSIFFLYFFREKEMKLFFIFKKKVSFKTSILKLKSLINVKSNFKIVVSDTYDSSTLLTVALR